MSGPLPLGKRHERALAIHIDLSLLRRFLDPAKNIPVLKLAKTGYFAGGVAK